MKSVDYLIIPDDLSGQRIDNFLMARLKGVPKSYIYKILRTGQVRANGGRVKQSYRIQAQDRIRVPPIRLSAPAERPSVRLSEASAQLLMDSILYEEEGFLVLNKPHGWAVHGGSGLSLGIIESLRLCHPFSGQLELVHRLDKGTSGCLMIAKRRSALRLLHRALQDSHVKKTYWALLKGAVTLKPGQGDLLTVDVALQKNQLQSGERIVRAVNAAGGGQAAKTHFRILATSPTATLVEAEPVTGRTHQIRVHALHLGHPVAGDEKYGERLFNQSLSSSGLNRLFLHAQALVLNLPERQALRVESPLPQELEGVLRELDFNFRFEML